MANHLKGRTVQKEYIARVKGRFPDGVVLCDQPMLRVSPVLGLNRVRASGKDARTKFRRIAYYPPRKKASSPAHLSATATLKTTTTTLPQPSTPTPADENEGYSIVHCLPLTGRTHQIRVHLQFLGHPITNDPIYSNRRVFGPRLGRADASGANDAEIIARLSRMGKTEVADSVSYPRPPTPPGTALPAPANLEPEDPANAARNSYQTYQTPPPACVTGDGTADPDTVNALLASEHGAMVAAYLQRKGEKLSGDICDICGTELYSDPGVHELGIFLHAIAYSDLTGAWRYVSRMPAWALPPDAPQDGDAWKAPEWREEEWELVVGTGHAETDTE